MPSLFEWFFGQYKELRNNWYTIIYLLPMSFPALLLMQHWIELLRSYNRKCIFDCILSRNLMPPLLGWVFFQYSELRDNQHTILHLILMSSLEISFMWRQTEFQKSYNKMQIRLFWHVEIWCPACLDAFFVSFCLAFEAKLCITRIVFERQIQWCLLI